VITSKLTSEAQTTIPQPIRVALKLKEGDELVYEIRGEQVVLTKARHVFRRR
jgi:antitoxin PrlF